MYILDTNVISNLHKNYYRKRFVSLWKAFDQLVANGGITSTREAITSCTTACQEQIPSGPRPMKLSS